MPTISAKGIITIPAATREKLKIAGGDRLTIEVVGQQIVLKKAPPLTASQVKSEMRRLLKNARTLNGGIGGDMLDTSTLLRLLMAALDADRKSIKRLIIQHAWEFAEFEFIKVEPQERYLYRPDALKIEGSWRIRVRLKGPVAS